MTPQEKADLISEEKRVARVLMQEMPRRLNAPMNVDRRHRTLREIAIKVSDAIRPHVICKRGCANCCHIANVISLRDAQLIGKFIGRKPAEVPFRLHDPKQQRETVEKYNGVPCPFLRGSDCTIYPVRPMSCIAHHSLEDSPDPCYSQDNIVRPVGQVDLALLHLAEVDQLHTEPFADLREFFP